MVEYPNWFSNVPYSLQATQDFYRVLHPGHFFQTFGPLSVLSAILFIIIGWRIAGVRNLVLVSLGLFIVIELLTFLYIYPRLSVLFDPSVMSQPLDAVKFAAGQFTIADRVRTLLMFVASGFAVAAAFRFARHHCAHYE
jgi:hypothetical protein